MFLIKKGFRAMLETLFLLQRIANKPTTNFFVKAPLCGAFTKKLGLV